MQRSSLGQPHGNAARGAVDDVAPHFAVRRVRVCVQAARATHARVCAAAAAAVSSDLRFNSLSGTIPSVPRVAVQPLAQLCVPRQVCGASLTAPGAGCSRTTRSRARCRRRLATCPTCVNCTRASRAAGRRVVALKAQHIALSRVCRSLDNNPFAGCLPSALLCSPTQGCAVPVAPMPVTLQELCVHSLAGGAHSLTPCAAPCRTAGLSARSRRRSPTSSRCTSARSCRRARTC